jgi:hypothetical protein
MLCPRPTTSMDAFVNREIKTGSPAKREELQHRFSRLKAAVASGANPPIG